MDKSKRFTDCPIVYEDADLVIIHKPSGVLSHPNSAKAGASQVAFHGTYEFSHRRFDSPAGSLWLIHRLDQDASGLLLAAKDRRWVPALRQLFDEHKIEKDYVVLLAGAVRPAKSVWRDALGERRESGRVRAFVMSSGSPNAELHYQLKQTFAYGGETLSLVQIRLTSGRTHQIRVQAAYRHHPVAGDEIYGRFTLNKRLKKEIGLRRIFLHAFRLAFVHPATGRKIEITQPMPDELESVLGKLTR